MKQRVLIWIGFLIFGISVVGAHGPSAEDFYRVIGEVCGYENAWDQLAAETQTFISSQVHAFNMEVMSFSEEMATEAGAKKIVTRAENQFISAILEFKKTSPGQSDRFKLDLALIPFLGGGGKAVSIENLVASYSGKESLHLSLLAGHTYFRAGNSAAAIQFLSQAIEAKDPLLSPRGERILFFSSPISRTLPDFPDGLSTDDLKPLKLSRFKGSPVIVHVWATYLSSASENISFLADIYKKYHEKGLEILSISGDDRTPRLEAYCKKHSLTWPQYADSVGMNNFFGNFMGTIALPIIYCLDSEGKCIWTGLPGRELSQKLEALFPK